MLSDGLPILRRPSETVWKRCIAAKIRANRNISLRIWCELSPTAAFSANFSLHQLIQISRFFIIRTAWSEPLLSIRTGGRSR